MEGRAEGRVVLWLEATLGHVSSVDTKKGLTGERVPIPQPCSGSWGLPDLRVYSQDLGNSSCINWKVRQSLRGAHTHFSNV